MITKAGKNLLTMNTKEIDDLNKEAREMAKEMKKIQVEKGTHSMELMELLQNYKENRECWAEKQQEITLAIGLEGFLK